MTTPDSQTPPRLRVAILGGGMFFDDIIGQTFNDFMRGGIAGGLSSIGMSHMAPRVANIGVEVVAVGTHSAKSGTAGKIVDWFAQDFPQTKIAAHYGDTVWKDIV